MILYFPLLILLSIWLSIPSFASDLPTYHASIHLVKGVVEKIASNHRQITIHHEAIPGYMMEMTMDFTIRNPKDLPAVAQGDQIIFTLHSTKDNSWIDHIQRVKSCAIPQKAPAYHPIPHLFQLHNGDQLPDGDFCDERGMVRHFSDFRGKVLAFTFFFTRCPIPDYCPRMNHNFEQTRKILNSSSINTSKWELLSLSFDSNFDNSRVLSSYAINYRKEDKDHWLFGVASPRTLLKISPPLGLMIMRQGNSLSHNLRTVVLDPHGRIYQQLNGNSWTPAQLAQIMQDALKASSKENTSL